MDDVTAAADGEVLSTVSLSMYANMRCDGDAGTAAATAATDCRGTRINIIITTSLSVSSSVTTSHRLRDLAAVCTSCCQPSALPAPTATATATGHSRTPIHSLHCTDQSPSVTLLLLLLLLLLSDAALLLVTSPWSSAAISFRTHLYRTH